MWKENHKWVPSGLNVVTSLSRAKYIQCIMILYLHKFRNNKPFRTENITRRYNDDEAAINRQCNF